MSKPKIFATGNEIIKGKFNISYYVIEKDKNFLNWLGSLLDNVLEVSNGEHKAKFITKESQDKYEVYAKEINKMIDIHEHYENKGNRVDLFYGNKRVYLTFRKSEETRKKFAKFIYKTKDWIKIAEKQEMPQYVKKIK